MPLRRSRCSKKAQAIRHSSASARSTSRGALASSAWVDAHGQQVDGDGGADEAGEGDREIGLERLGERDAGLLDAGLHEVGGDAEGGGVHGRGVPAARVRPGRASAPAGPCECSPGRLGPWSPHAERPRRDLSPCKPIGQFLTLSDRTRSIPGSAPAIGRIREKRTGAAARQGRIEDRVVRVPSGLSERPFRVDDASMKLALETKPLAAKARTIVIETELKIALDAAGMARLRRHPALAGLRLAPRRTRDAGLGLLRHRRTRRWPPAGVALRLRRVGRRWVQTIKRRSGGGRGQRALRQPRERVSGAGRPAGARRARSGRRAGRGRWRPPAARRWRRSSRRTCARLTERLRAPDGGEVELALDSGEIRAGEARAPIREAELELKAGEVGAVYGGRATALRRRAGAFRGRQQVGARLPAGATAARPSAEAGPRHAATLAVDREATVETVARDVLRDCLAQIAEQHGGGRRERRGGGPAPAAGRAAAAAHRLPVCSARASARRRWRRSPPTAQRLGQRGRAAARQRRADRGGGRRRRRRRGRCRRRGGAGRGAGGAARGGARRGARGRSPAPEAVGFLFDLGAFIEGRGWLAPSDYLADRAAGDADRRRWRRRSSTRAAALVLKRGRKHPQARRRGAARAAQGS